MEWFLKVLLGALLITSKSEAVKIAPFQISYPCTKNERG